jgi:Cu-Zn family superoxide dismutase
MEAVAVLVSPKVYGYVVFTQVYDDEGIPESVQVKVDLVKDLKTVPSTLSAEGLNESFHGFHIHASGDLRRGCDSCCKHYNPKKKTHGGLFDEESHAGDLGNIRFDEKGNCKDFFETNKFTVQEILGRSIVVHEDPDDLGQGTGEDREESLKTGRSGKRLACGCIGLSENTCEL